MAFKGAICVVYETLVANTGNKGGKMQPRSIRNFWVKLDVDGRETSVAAGPRAKDGGFNLTVYQRTNGGITEALTLGGRADQDGELTLYVMSKHELTARPLDIGTEMTLKSKR